MDKKQLLALSLWATLVALAFGWLTATVPIRSDLSHFLPASSNPIEKVLQQKLREGVASRLILIGVDGGSLQQRVNASQQLRQRLLKLSAFKRVENGTIDSFQADPLLFKYRYLLNETTTFTPQALQQAFKERMQELTGPIPSPFKRYLPQDPTSAYPTLLKQWLPPSRPNTVQGVWFSNDQQRALLIAETYAKGMEMDSQQEAINAIQQALTDIDSSGQLKLNISGPGVFAVHSRALIRGESQLLSALSSIAIMLILLLVYHSWRITILAALPLATAMLTGSCVTGLIFGELHGITLAFGITLLGVTIDYPIHLFSHLKKDETATNSLRRIWPTLRMGVITTCIGYMVMATTDFRGLNQLGVFTIAGLLAGALCTRWLLPQLIGEGWQLNVDKVSKLIPSFSGYAAGALLIVALCSLLYITTQQNSIWQDDMSSMSALPKQLLQLDQEMRGELNAPELSHLIILHNSNLEAALQQAESLETTLQSLVKTQNISGFDIATQYLPSQQRQQQRQERLPPSEVLNNNLQQALQGQQFRPNLFAPFLGDVAAAKKLPLLELEGLTGTLAGQQLANLVSQEGDEWFLLVPLYGVKNIPEITRLIDQANISSIHYLQLGEEGRRMVVGFRDEIFSRIGWGVMAMSLLLLFGLKSLRATLLVMVPVFIAITLTVGLLVLLGQKLTIFHLVALMLVVGIGIDYSLFFSRKEISAEDRRRTFHALAICALSTSTVFTILASSAIPVLNAIGLTTAIGVVVSFLAAMVLARQAE